MVSEDKPVAIILARGGSKRLPRKNILPINGKPMIEWTIDACISSGIFSNVVVSTDCNEIADIARSAKAEVPFLRKEASDDISSASQATLATLHQYEEYYNSKPKTVCQLMANCPFRTADDIRSGYFHFIDNKAQSQISVFKFGWMNPWWALKKMIMVTLHGCSRSSEGKITRSA